MSLGTLRHPKRNPMTSMDTIQEDFIFNRHVRSFQQTQQQSCQTAELCGTSTLSWALILNSLVFVFVDPNTNQQKGTQCCGGWARHAGVRRFGRHERILAGLLEFGFKWVKGFFSPSIRVWRLSNFGLRQITFPVLAQPVRLKLNASLLTG